MNPRTAQTTIGSGTHLALPSMQPTLACMRADFIGMFIPCVVGPAAGYTQMYINGEIRDVSGFLNGAGYTTDVICKAQIQGYSRPPFPPAPPPPPRPAPLGEAVVVLVAAAGATCCCLRLQWRPS